MTAARKTAAAKTTTRKAATPRKAAAKKAAPPKAAAKKPGNKVSSSAEEKRGPGRPPLLQVNPDLQRDIVTYVRGGAFPERAAVAVGISERTHYAWMALGRDEQERRAAGEAPDDLLQMYVSYTDAIERAVAEAEMLLLGTALKAGATGGAAMNILERRFRDRWGAKAPTVAPTAPATTTGPATGLDMLEQRRQAREQATR